MRIRARILVNIMTQQRTAKTLVQSEAIELYKNLPLFINVAIGFNVILTAAEFMLFTEGILNGLHGTSFEETFKPETGAQSSQRRVTHKNIKYLLDGNHVCCLCGYKSVNSSNVVYHVR